MNPEEIIAEIRAYTRKHGQPPDLRTIETWADFRQRGGLGRVLTALQISASARDAHPAGMGDAKSVADALNQQRATILGSVGKKIVGAMISSHQVDDGDPEEPPLIVCTADELRETIRKALS